MVEERRFEVPVGGETVPGVVWSRAGGAWPRPTVLIGHGRASDKSSPYVVEIARRFAGEHGVAAVAVDAPGHGERREVGAADVPPKPDADQTRQEWTACLEFLIADGTSDAEVIGYWGLSMGTGLGLALLASEPRIRCAALGLMHTRYHPRLLADAAAVACPVLFSMHWDDTRVPRDEALALFDALGTGDKRLHAYPGDHGDFTDEELGASVAFVGSRLGAVIPG